MMLVLLIRQMEHELFCSLLRVSRALTLIVCQAAATEDAGGLDCSCMRHHTYVCIYVYKHIVRITCNVQCQDISRPQGTPPDANWMFTEPVYSKLFWRTS